MPRCRIGIAFAALYLTAAAILYYRALVICRDGMFCGIAVLPVNVPAGILYSMALAAVVDTPPILQWPVIALTVITNTVLYYLLGCLIRSIGRKVFRVGSTHSG